MKILEKRLTHKDNDYEKVIPDYNGYTCNKDGEIFSLITGIKIKQALNGRGYLHVSLCENRRRHTLTVHRIVAKMFVKNERNEPFINHKDGNKLNNRYENLEWCTGRDNTMHAIKNNLFTPPAKNNTACSKPVIQYSLNGVIINEFPSAAEAGRQLKLQKTHIARCCNNTYGYKTSGGFKWKFKSSIEESNPAPPSSTQNTKTF